MGSKSGCDLKVPSLGDAATLERMWSTRVGGEDVGSVLKDSRRLRVLLSWVGRGTQHRKEQLRKGRLTGSELERRRLQSGRGTRELVSPLRCYAPKRYILFYWFDARKAFSGL